MRCLFASQLAIFKFFGLYSIPEWTCFFFFSHMVYNLRVQSIKQSTRSSNLSKLVHMFSLCKLHPFLDHITFTFPHVALALICLYEKTRENHFPPLSLQPIKHKFKHLFFFFFVKSNYCFQANTNHYHKIRRKRKRKRKKTTILGPTNHYHKPTNPLGD